MSDENKPKRSRTYRLFCGVATSSVVFGVWTGITAAVGAVFGFPLTADGFRDAIQVTAALIVAALVVSGFVLLLSALVLANRDRKAAIERQATVLAAAVSDIADHRRVLDSTILLLQQYATHAELASAPTPNTAQARDLLNRMLQRGGFDSPDLPPPRPASDPSRRPPRVLRV